MEFPLNENQKRRLRITLEQVDELLEDALRALEVRSRPSPFSRLVPDAPPGLEKEMEKALDRLRERMFRILEREEVPRPEPNLSALWFLTRIIHQGPSRKPGEARQFGHPQGRGPEACLTTRRGPEARGRPEWRAYLGLQQEADE